MADDYQITDESVIKFHDLYRGQEEDGLVLVGRRDIGSYMSIPVGALEVIDLLNSGKHVSEVKKMLEEKYGEEAEFEGFIEDMAANEMVKSIDGIEIATTSQVQKDLFSRITAQHVGWMFSKPAQIVYGGMAAACLAIFTLRPQYIPEPRDFFFHEWYSVAVGLMFFFGWIFVAAHELAHLFAAKSVGTEGYFSLSNRLVFVVAQTNLGNIWTVPREKRYIVYFAGMAWDTVMVFTCLIVLLCADQGIAVLPELWYNFLKAVVFVKVWGIVWQFRFNMQTDVYYAVANYFKCRNLLGDAQSLIKNFFAAFWKRIKRVDMSDMPEYEMKAIKYYTPLYLVGTLVTLVAFFFRTLLILLLQVERAFHGITIGYAAGSTVFIDAAVLITLNAFSYSLLGFLILRPRWGSLKQRFRAVF